MKSALARPLCGLFVAVLPVFAYAAPAPLNVTATGIGKDGRIAPDYAFCVPSAAGHVKPGPDNSLGISWSKGPKGTESYALLAIDVDVPVRFDDAGKEGRTIADSAPRRDFTHWVLFDIPKDTTALPAGIDSQAVVQHGKSVLNTPYGMRGVNDYAGYFASDPAHAGIYAGYDGPCPPWNDARLHHYHFHVYALDKKLHLKGPVTAAKLKESLENHVIAEGETVATYSLNPLVHDQTSGR